MANTIPPPPPQPPVPKKRANSVLSKICIGILVIGILAAIGAVTPKPHRESDEEKAENARSEWRWNVTRLIKAEILKNLHDPESVKWESIGTDEYAKLVCVVYRARNGFNAMRKAVLVVVDGKTYTTDAAWNSHCAGRTLYMMPEL